MFKTISVLQHGRPTEDEIVLIETKLKYYIDNSSTNGTVNYGYEKDGICLTREWTNREHALEWVKWTTETLHPVSCHLDE